MTAEEAIAAIAKEMKEQALLEAHKTTTTDDPFHSFYLRSKSYWHISNFVEEVTGEPTGITKPH